MVTLGGSTFEEINLSLERGSLGLGGPEDSRPMPFRLDLKQKAQITTLQLVP
jgi:hypothetical protein